MLGGVKADKTYEFVNVDTDEKFVITGDELIKKGIQLKINNKRESLLLKYTYA